VDRFVSESGITGDAVVLVVVVVAFVVGFAVWFAVVAS
jgi:hypothetical protein